MGVLFVIFFASAIATLVAALVPLSLIGGLFDSRTAATRRCLDQPARSSPMPARRSPRQPRRLFFGG